MNQDNFESCYDSQKRIKLYLENFMTNDDHLDDWNKINDYYKKDNSITKNTRCPLFYEG